MFLADRVCALPHLGRGPLYRWTFEGGVWSLRPHRPSEPIEAVRADPWTASPCRAWNARQIMAQLEERQ